MPNPYALYAIAKGAQAAGRGIGALLRKRRPSLENTAYGRYLKRVGKEGIYTPGAKRRIISRGAREAGRGAGVTRAELRGFGASKFGDSIATRRAVAEPQLALQRQTGEIAADVELESELSKTQARREFARQRFATEEQRRVEGQQRTADIIGGVSGIGGAILEGAAQKQVANIAAEKDTKKREMQIFQMISSARTPEQAQMIYDYYKEILEGAK